MRLRCYIIVSIRGFQGVMNRVPWVGNIALSSLQLHLVDLTTTSKRHQASPGHVCVSPIRHTELEVVLRFYRQSNSTPCQKCLALGNEPILSAIKLHCDDRGYRGLRGDEGGDGARGGDLLVEEGNSERRTSEGFQEGEGRQGVFNLAAQADQCSTACV